MEEMREETQAEEPQIGQEQAQSAARLGALTVLQQHIRELLPTLPPAVALGHQTPVREAIAVMRQKQLSCVLVVERGQLVGVFTERDVVTKVAATPLDVDHVPLRDVMQPDPERLQLDDALVYALHQMLAARTGMFPSWTSSGGPPPSCRCKRLSTRSSRRSRTSSATSPHPRRTPLPPRQRARKGGMHSPRLEGALRAGDAWSLLRFSRSWWRMKPCQLCVSSYTYCISRCNFFGGKQLRVL